MSNSGASDLATAGFALDFPPDTGVAAGLLVGLLVTEAPAAALIGFGVFSFLRNARASHFEGFVFVIAIVLVLQGLLMLLTLGRQSHQSQTAART